MIDRIALGTAQFGLHYGIANSTERVTTGDAARILGSARAAGVDTLDTAVAYGDSEQTLGKVGVEDWKIITKLPAVPDNCPDVEGWVDASIRASLARLRVDRLDAVLLHRPGQLWESHGDELLAGLLAAKRDGLTKKVGVSIYDPEDIRPLFDLYRFDIIQAPLSIIDQRILTTGSAAWLSEQGVALHTRSAFLQGLLLMPAQARPAKFNRWANVWREWDRWLAVTGMTQLEACLRFVLSAENVEKAVIGFDSVDHFNEMRSAALEPLKSLPQWPELDPMLLNPSFWSQL